MKAALQALPDSTVTCCLAPPPVRRGYVRIGYTNYPCWTESDSEDKKQVKCPFQSCVLLALLVFVCFVTPTCFLFCLNISVVYEPPLCASLTPLLQMHRVGWIRVFSVGFSNNSGPFLCTVVLKGGSWFSKACLKPEAPPASSWEDVWAGVRIHHISFGLHARIWSSVLLKDGQGGTETKDLCIYFLVGSSAKIQRLHSWEAKQRRNWNKKQDFNREQQSGSLVFNR